VNDCHPRPPYPPAQLLSTTLVKFEEKHGAFDEE